jgi:hypothetical protein
MTRRCRDIEGGCAGAVNSLAGEPALAALSERGYNPLVDAVADSR